MVFINLQIKMYFYIQTYLANQVSTFFFLKRNLISVYVLPFSFGDTISGVSLHVISVLLNPCQTLTRTVPGSSY